MSMASSTRADRALVTRRRMVRAAYDLFCDNGYLGTTISAIAKEAGVAVPTIYYTFGTKAVLLSEALGAAIVGFDRWRPPPADPQIDELLPWNHWWEEFESSPTSDAAFDTFFSHGVGILERAAPLVATLHGASGDPEAAEVLRTSEERRLGAYRESVRIIAAKPGGLRPGLTVAKATDILLVLFSAELYQSVRTGRGWSAERTESFLYQLLTTQLLAA
ncbi:helix-turn-helix domain-containing protein [Nocardioides sp. NPDC127503]|uniref:TetR/AcrR family transcriptional regulator n=1 Tax=Nocardioides sp. NPDC127503 TaxID=3154516 RepID=UPI0033181B4E